MKARRLLAPLLAAMLVAAIVIAAASASQKGSSAAGAKKWKIALANSFIGNTWRVEMENLFKAGCNMPPYKTQVTCSVYNSGNDVGKQTQQISNLISSHVDAIVLNAASPTGLNGIIKQACARGIVVVSFDNVVTAPCAQTVNTDQFKFGQQGAQFLVDRLHGKGNVIMVTGVAGTFADHERNRGVDSVFKKNPGIKVAARYSGNWDSSAAQRATAAQLPSLPDIQGAWVSGGTDGMLKAFVDAGKPLPVTAGEAENGFRRFLLPGGYKGKHADGMSIGQPPFLSLVSFELARAILAGQHKKSNIIMPFPVVTDKTVKAGLTVFPALPDSFFADFTDSGPKATLVICVKAALTGKPCPGALKIRLP
ncbi:MAG: ribose transport system substrate-binding protein [Gaiellaceae bacterium]|nr:ribose transport system substrate-binding protein [Gaiellaceae bacterium]